MWKTVFVRSVDGPWLIELELMGNVEICVTETRLGQKHSVTPLLQFLTCVLNRAKFPTFFSLCVAGLRRPFTVKQNWAREDCPFPQSRRRTHKSRHPSFVTPLSPSSWFGPAAFQLRVFYGTNVSINPAEWPSAAKPPRRSMGGMDPPSRPVCSSLCVGRGKRNLILAGFSLGPLLWFYSMLLAWRH